MRVTRTIFDIEQFDNVLVGKDVEFKDVTSTHEALERLGNDGTELINIINIGLQAKARKAAYEDNDGWHTFVDESKGAMSDLNGEFTGTPVSVEGLNGLVLNLAKTVFGYNKATDAAGRKASKEQAMAYIKSQPVIIDSLKSQALTDGE